MAITVTDSAGNTISVSVSGGTSTSFTTTSTSVSVSAPDQSSVEVKAQGPKGDTGETGPQGPAGIGPAGGTENQFVQKNSATDYDTKWSAYTLPAADGVGRQVLMTDGAGTVSFAYPQTIAEDVKNVSGGTLVKGTPVHVTGSVGNLAEVIAADASTNYPAHFVLDEDLADEAEGKGIALGFINNVDVPDASIYTEGQTVYLGASGGWTTTKPTGTNAIQNLGILIKVNTSGNKVSGIIMGAGRANDVPNIPDGQAWIGNASGVATPTTLADVATSGAYSDLSGTPSIPVSGVDFDPVGTDNSTDVTLAGAYNYLTLLGQQITLGQVDYTTDISNTPTIPSALSDLTGTSDDIAEGATNKFLTSAEETKLGHISVTQAVDLDTMESDIATNNAKVSNVTTDLSTTTAASSVTVNSSDGTDATINAATTTVAGVMSGADKTKLDGISAGAEVNAVDSVNTQTGAVVLDADDIDDTTTTHKFTTASDISKLSGIEASADVTDSANVTSSLVGATAISAGDKTTIQTNLGVDPSGTDNSTDVTLAGSYNYLTLSGQQITLGQVDYTTDISNTPTIPSGDLVDDTTPQLGGNLDVNGNKIVSTSNGDIDIEPNGTGNVLLGNFKFDADQTVGSGQDDYVLTYDHTAGTIGLEAASGGGGGTITALNNQAENRLTTIGATTTELDGEANLTFDGTTLTVSGEVKADQIYVNARFPASPSNGHFTEGARIGRGFFTSGSITAGALYVLGASSWTLADADAASTGSGLLVVGTDAASAAEVVLEGCVKLGSNTGFSGASKGDVLYLSTTGGEVTTTAPSGTGDIVRVVGYVLNATNGQIYFNPDNTWIEL